jgi:hypothetical protein
MVLWFASFGVMLCLAAGEVKATLAGGIAFQQNRSRYSRGVTPRFRSKASRIPSVVL